MVGNWKSVSSRCCTMVPYFKKKKYPLVGCRIELREEKRRNQVENFKVNEARLSKSNISPFLETVSLVTL